VDTTTPNIVRPEIQALRALAVMLVVVYHLWPTGLTGGFVGVDVFFAISGFLITAHLLREVQKRGTVSLPAFWARRARRLLPASLLVIAVSAVATVTSVPQIYWKQFFAEIIASTVYLQNWRLAADAVDYLAASNDPSPVQHYWSLSAEEQFYLLWPVLIVVAVLVARRLQRVGSWRAIGVVLGTVTAASLAYSVYLTDANPAAAYFVTPTRAWEFGAGGLLALWSRPGAGHLVVRSVTAWAGYAAIGVTAVTYSVSTPFPGYTALLPILGTLAVIWAGAPTLAWSPTRLVSLRPVQFLGDVSYSIYLWHWPMIILTPYLLGLESLTDRDRVLVLLASIGLAWATKVLVEDPVRTGAFLTRRKPRFTFALVVVATGALIGFSQLGINRVEARIAAAQRAADVVAARAPRCFGAASRDPEKRCVNHALDRMVVPTPAAAIGGKNGPCTPAGQVGLIRMCAFGAPKEGATATIVLVGDSHAEHIRAPLDIVARRKGWYGLSVTRSGCPASQSVKALPEPDRSQCIAWNRQLLLWLRAHPEIGLLFSGQISGSKVVPVPGQDDHTTAVQGYLDEWALMPPTVKHVVVFRDNPKGVGNALVCVDKALTAGRNAPKTCARPRSRALTVDPAEDAAVSVRDQGRVGLIDLTDFFCSASLCYPVVGGALVYRDRHHMNLIFARTLAPYVERQYDALAAGWR
jgi:peptidoglycan/LPS O-acetylase OafA/YrhL